MSYKHRVVSALAQHAPGLLPLRHLGAYHYSNKFFIGDDDEYAGVDYAAVYEHYLRPWRRRCFTLLELGVYRGESLRTWRDYFPKAQVVGLDIDPEAARLASEFTVYVGSQADAELLSRVKFELPRIEVIIDDASHLNHLTVQSFRLLFPHLAPGGLYFIEDISRDSGPLATSDWPGMQYNVGVESVNRHEDLDELFAELSHDTTLGARRTVDFVHVWPRIAVVGRAATSE